MRRLVLLSLLLVGAAALPARAEHVNRRWVAADATWMIHVDMAAVMASDLGRHVMNHPHQMGWSDDELEQFIRETGIDPRENMTGFTVYGRGEPDEKLVAVITMNQAIDRLIERMREEPQYWKVEHEGLTFHAWVEGDEKILLHVRDRDRDGGRLVLVSGDRDALTRGVRVVEGTVPSVAAAKNPVLQASPREGSLIYAEATDLPWLEDGENPASAIIRQMNRLIVDLGEEGEENYLHVTVTADSSEDATDIADILQGIIALGRVIGDSDPQLAPLEDLCRGLRINSESRYIHVEARYRTQHLKRLLQHVGEMHDHDDAHEHDDDDEHEDHRGDRDRREHRRDR